MNDKVLIKIIVPEIDETFDLFVPVNELVWKVKTMIIQCINSLSSGALDVNKTTVMINKNTGYVYPNNTTILQTDIRNGTEILLVCLLYY